MVGPALSAAARDTSRSDRRFALLFLVELGLYRMLGPGLALALFLVFIVTLTLVPALLAIIGPAAFGERGQARLRTPPWQAILRRPGPAAAILVAGLLFAAAGSLGLRVGFDQLANLSDDATSARGYEQLTGEFPEGGVLAPVNVFIQGEDLNERGEELLRLQNGLQGELSTPTGPRSSSDRSSPSSTGSLAGWSRRPERSGSTIAPLSFSPGTTA